LQPPEQRSRARPGTRAAAIYELNDGDCLDIGTPDHVFALGNEIALDDFPRLHTIDIGGERLQSRYVATSDGSLAATGEWFDTDLGEGCVPRAFPDGITRCAPYQIAFPGQYFADDACTASLYATYNGGVCGSLPARLFAVDTEYGCEDPSVQQVFELSSFDGPSYTNQGDGCVTADLAADGNVVFERGEEIPPEDLVTVELVER
jgi:hypothetical protein